MIYEMIIFDRFVRIRVRERKGREKGILRRKVRRAYLFKIFGRERV